MTNLVSHRVRVKRVISTVNNNDDHNENPNQIGAIQDTPTSLANNDNIESENVSSANETNNNIITSNKSGLLKSIEDHSGALGLILTLTTAAISGYLALLIYAYQYFFNQHFSINDTWIDVSNMNGVLFVIMMLCIGSVLMFSNIIPIIIAIYPFKFKWRKWCIIISRIIVIVVLGVLLWVVLQQFSSSTEATLLIWFILYGLGVLVAIINAIDECIQKKKPQVDANPRKAYLMIIAAMIIWFIVGVYGVGSNGMNDAKNKKDFQVIACSTDTNQVQVVLTEDEERFLVADGIINEEGLTIYKNRQQVIDKQNVHYEITHFNTILIIPADD